MDKKLQEELIDSVFIAERRTGRKLDVGTVYDVLRYSLRKLEAIGKGMDYLPLLFENELRDFVMREEINCIGALSAPTTVLGG